LKALTYLSLMAGAVLVPVVLVSTVSLNTLLQAERLAMHRSMQETARGVVANLERELSNAHTLLRVLSTSASLQSGDLAAFHAQANGLNTERKTWTVLLDQDARQVLNTTVPFGVALPPPVRKELVQRVIAGGKVQVSDLLTGPLTGSFVTAVAYPIGTDPQHGQVLVQTFVAEYFDRVFPDLRNRPNWLIGIFDREGRTIVRSRQPREGLIGQPPGKILLDAIRTRREDVFRNQSRDGVEIYSVLAHSPLSGWTVGIGVPVEEIESAAHRAVLLSVFGLAAAIVCATVLATLCGRWLIDSVAGAVRSARALGHGQMPERLDSRVTEFNDLHAAHVEAGALLSQERGSRIRAEREREDLLLLEQAARREAEMQNRQKDQFLAMLGHELRNPLAGIVGATGVLRSDQSTAAHRQLALDILDRQGAHLTRIVDDLLDVARVTTGKIELLCVRMDLAAVAGKCVENLSAAGRLARHDFTFDAMPAWVMADPTRMEQVVNNLIGNAIKFTPPGGTIVVCVTAKEGWAEFTVRDSGCGISPELLPHVFDMFVQGPTTLDRTQSGLGIGLSLVQQVVELHQGSVTAHSEGAGAGSEFTVRLPLAKEA
jgi:signal transduction histidine kinase